MSVSVASGRDVFVPGRVAGSRRAGTLVPAAARPPLMNLGYWGDGAVTAREAQVTLVRQLADRLPELGDRLVLDAGCRHGGLACMLAQDYGAVVQAVNPDAHELELARDHAAHQGMGERVGFYVAPLSRLPFADGCFDAVFAVETAAATIDKRAFADEAYRVLAPGGWVALTGPTLSHGAPLGRRLADGRALVTADQWRLTLERAGLEVRELSLIGREVYPGHLRSLMLTADGRREEILASLERREDRRRGSWHRGRAWLDEFAAHRSAPALASALRLRDYVRVLARRPVR